MNKKLINIDDDLNNYKEITLDYKNEECLTEKCEFFLKDLEENIKFFDKELKKNEEEFNKSLKQKSKLNKNNFFKKYKKTKLISNFEPENIKIKSCFTVLDSKWGEGKTYFLENFCKLINEEKITPTLIKKIIWIDAIHFSSCNNIPDQFMIQIIDKILDNKIRVNKITKQIMIDSSLYIFNKITNLITLCKNVINYFKLQNEKLNVGSNKHNHDVAIEKLNKYTKKWTLIIIDNIERINQHSWEIIRSIQKLLLAKNLIFLIPVNVKKLNSLINKNVDKNEGEWQLQKYINIGSYKFKQEYKNILEKLGIENNEHNKIICTTLEFLNEEKHINMRYIKNIIDKSIIDETKKCPVNGSIKLIKKINDNFLNEESNNNANWFYSIINLKVKYFLERYNSDIFDIYYLIYISLKEKTISSSMETAEDIWNEKKEITFDLIHKISLLNNLDDWPNDILNKFNTHKEIDYLKKLMKKNINEIREIINNDELCMFYFRINEEFIYLMKHEPLGFKVNDIKNYYLSLKEHINSNKLNQDILSYYVNKYNLSKKIINLSFPII